MSDLITQAEFARRHGVTRQAVHDLVSRQVIRLTPEGLLDEQAATEAIARTRDPARETKLVGIPGGAQGNVEHLASFQSAKTRRELAEAALAEHKLAIETGRYADIDAVRSAWCNLAALIGARLRTLCNSPEIPEVARSAVARMVNGLLEDLAKHDPQDLIKRAD